LKAGMVGALTLGARPTARTIALSKAFQNLSARPSYNTPIAELAAGEAVKNNRLAAAMRAGLPASYITEKQ